MVEVEKTGPPKLRKLYYMGGMSSGYQFRVHNDSFKNLRRGLLERVFYVENNKKELVDCPQPEQGVFRELRGLRRRLVRIVGTHTPISMEQFVDCYQGRKRTIYQQAVDSLSERALDRKDAALRTFVKAEKFNISVKPDPAPRVIQPRDPRYNVCVGRYLKKLEHHIVRGLDKIWGGPTVMKGYDVEGVAKHAWDAWSQFQIPVGIGFDMKRFDQHVSVPALQFEHSCYMACYEGDEVLKELLSWQLMNHGVGLSSNGIIKYKVAGKRMSGDMNTGMGNCLLACLITKRIVRGIKCRLINNGDDCVLFCERSDAARIQAVLTTGWARFGFQCIAEEPVHKFEQLSFCQMQPIHDGDKWVMVRSPKIAMSKDSHSLVPWDNLKQARIWIRAVGECGLAIAGGIPIMQEFYQRMYTMGGQCNTTNVKGRLAGSGFYELAKLSRRGYRPVTDEARVSFWEATGVVPDAQEALEELISGMGTEVDWWDEAPSDELGELIKWNLVNQWNMV